MEINDVVRLFSRLGQMSDSAMEQDYPRLYRELEKIGSDNGTGMHGTATRIQVLLVAIIKDEDPELRLDVRTLLA